MRLLENGITEFIQNKHKKYPQITIKIYKNKHKHVTECKNMKYKYSTYTVAPMSIDYSHHCCIISINMLHSTLLLLLLVTAEVEDQSEFNSLIVWTSVDFSEGKVEGTLRIVLNYQGNEIK